MERPTTTADNIECFRSFFELRKWEKVSTKLSLPDDRDRQDQLTPWHFWALVCLARHHLRQNWVADIVQFRLQGNLEAISAAGSFGHPEIPQTGIVPKDNEWEYYFHGRGCCLTHRGTGEQIDVDFFDDSGDYFSLWFYKCFLKSLKTPQLPEQRLIDLHPSKDSFFLTAAELFKSDACEKHSERDVYKLSTAIVEQIPQVEAFCSFLDQHKKDVAVACVFGDWIWARQLCESDTHANERKHIERLANNLTEKRLQELHLLFEDSDHKRNTLAAIHDVSPAQANVYISKLLKGAASGDVSFALQLIDDSNDPKWCPQVFSLFQRVDPNADIPEPHIWNTCATFLLRHSYNQENIVGKFDLVKNRSSADVALLALRFASDKAIRLFQIALRSSIPMERITASAALAIIDQPWSRQELIKVLSESKDQEMTLYARGALYAGAHPEDHQIVESWESKYPRQAETGEFITFGELSVRQRDDRIKYEMQKLHDQVFPLRNVRVS